MVVTTSLGAILAVAISLGTAAAQQVDPPADTLIRLQRISCRGPCPVYTITIDARGGVTYVGERFVRIVGRQTAQVDPSAVLGLLIQAERIRFFELLDAYRLIEASDGAAVTVADLPTTTVTITVNGRTKRVEDFVGAPDSLPELERTIDAVAGTRRWTFLDEESLEDLLRAGWRSSSKEGTVLLRQAIESDEVAIARRLIETGAKLDGPPGRQAPPLFSARSGSMVELLVKTGANPNERLTGSASTALMATAHKDLTVADALVKAGASIEDMDNGRTALWYAACAGNWRVVSVLLDAGANPRGSAERSAADCTRQARRAETDHRRTVLDRARGRPTVADFDEVIALLESAEKGRRR